MDFSTPLQYIGDDFAQNRLYIKRDDLLPFSFGGNKVRIAQCYLQDMQHTSGSHVVCYGNARSNLCRAMSNACYAKGLPCTIVSPADDDGSRHATANGQLCRLCRADIVPCTKQTVAQTVSTVLKRIEANGQVPYYIYGNCEGTGRRAVPVRAYYPVLEEILSQAQAEGFVPDRIALAVGTGTTAAGLLCALADSKRETLPVITGISIARDKQAVLTHIHAYVSAWALENGRDAAFADRAMARLEIIDDYREVYGRCPAEARRFIYDFYCRCGIALDETYTGKALHGLYNALQQQRIQNEHLVFLHTGGTPLFFDTLLQNRTP